MPTLNLRRPQVPKRGQETPLLWPRSQIEAIYEMVQGASSWLGFHHLTTIRDMIRANQGRGNVWVALEDDEEMLGFTYVGSRRLYPHLMRNGDLYVFENRWRERIATALYFAVFCQAVLEGRRQLEDTIIYDLSPFMANSFLPSLGYTRLGVLLDRTSGFRDIHLFGLDITLESYELFLERLPVNFGTVELADSPGTRDRFEKQMTVYERHRPKIVPELRELRNHVRQYYDIEEHTDG